MRKLTKFLMPISAIALVIPALATQAQAQGSQDEAIEEIVTTGLRGKPRSAVDSAVPIDTFDTASIEAVSHADTQDILQTLVPSYNVGREPISDGSSFIRPAELRGLPTHHTLVLVNGKRRHRAALVGIGGAGEQGPDVATIPAAAIKSIEVLRDGASSQYGSDAIAGVINFNLKDDNDGFTLTAGTGSYFEGDGDEYNISGNVGLPLGENGFLSISAEYDTADYTHRDTQYCESWFCLDPNNPTFASTPQYRQDYVNGVPTVGLTPYENTLQLAFPAGIPAASVIGGVAQPWGQPNVESTRVFVNSGYTLDSGVELYGFGSYSDSTADGGFFYRYPGNGTIELLRNADGSLYSPLEKFPGGFDPRFEGTITDVSAAGGVRGSLSDTFSYDVSLRYGSDEIDYHMWNTVNPSYGIDSPTDFRPGTLTNEETQFQVDLVSEFDAGMASPVTFAYGASYMDESYDVGQSADVPSYDAGPHALQDPYGFCTDEADPAMRTPTAVAGTGDFTSSLGGQAAVSGVAATAFGLNCTDTSDPVYTVVGVGANGFPGYSPAFSDKYTRDSWAVYADLSADVTDTVFLQAAARYEDYSDFGNELVGKIAGRVLLSEQFALRASVGTGFRAPTPGQQGTTNVSTRLPNGLPVATGLFPASGPVAQALGAVPLKAETSTSYTVGFTADLDKLTVTVDYYDIKIDDRFSAISTRDVSTNCPGVTQDEMDACNNYLALAAAGVAGAETIGGVFYFTNAFDSKTTGLDIVASYPFEWANGQETNVQFAANYNKSSLESDASDYLNEEDRFDFENRDPNIRWNLTATHTAGDLSVMGRARYYGESDNANNNTTPLSVQTYDPVMYFDLEGSYQINDNWRVTAGGRNIFDQYPDKISKVLNDYCCGRVYDSGSVVPWQGGYYFGRVTVSF